MNQQMHIALADLAPGFVDPALDAQRVFRQLLRAMSRPGHVLPVDRLPEAPLPLRPATAAVALTLFDLDTPIWLSPELRGPAEDYLAFHTGAPHIANLGAAAFLLVADGLALPDLSCLALGDPEYPERAATLVIQVDRLRIGAGRRLRGPGILGHIDLAVDGLAETFWGAFRLNRTRFPLGFDAFLVSGEGVVGLPRTVVLDSAEN